MSNTDLIIEERSRDIGDFLVGRLIPFRKKRMIGPFIFIDHMGPAQLKDYQKISMKPVTMVFKVEPCSFTRDEVGMKLTWADLSFR